MLILNIKDLKSLIKFAGLALLTLSLSNCSILDQNPKPGLVEPSAAVPGDFLFSWHKPYNKWMDTPVRVYYNDVSLEEIFEDSVAVLRFGGGCQGCGMVDVTLKDGVEKTLLTQIPQLTEVRDITDHSITENAYY